MPTFVRRYADMLPKRRGAADKTVGIVTDPEGRLLRPKPLRSGEDGPGKGAPGLRRDDPAIPWHALTILDHVEAHASALMRTDNGPPRVVLVVNNEPCHRKRLSCHRLLPGMIPRGSTLAVYVRYPDGTTKHWSTYNGHGRGVAR